MGSLLGRDGVPLNLLGGFHHQNAVSSVSTELGRPAATLASDQNRNYHFGPKCD